MWNRIDKGLSPADISDIHNAMQNIKVKISTGTSLTTDERKKGGWYLSPKAMLMLEQALTQAKAQPANFPSVDLAAFERDIKLIKQMATIESEIYHLQNLLQDNRRLLTKDASEQGFYI